MGKLSLGRPKCGHGHLIEAAACNRGLRSHSFLQLFGDFDYWLLNGGWRLNKTVAAECRFNCNGGFIHVSFIVNKVRFITNNDQLI